MSDDKVIIFDRYTEKELSGHVITLDRSSPRNHHIRFNTSACVVMGLTDKLYIQFIKIGDDWFVCTTTLKRGYKLTGISGRNLRINSGLFVRQLLKEWRYSEATIRLPLLETGSEYEGRKLFMIKHGKPLKK